MQKITPFLFFENNAQEAIDFYKSVFSKAEVTSTANYTEAGPMPAGSFMMATLKIEDLEFGFLNGGPFAKFTPAISFAVSCENQQEVDRLWDALKQGGQEMDCGWVTDKFGVSWQIVPKALMKLVNDPDRDKAAKAMRAMMTMKKIDIATIEKAAA